jgi:hypothetical protein
MKDFNKGMYVVARYLVAFLIINYGFAKLNGAQFTTNALRARQAHAGRQRIHSDVVPFKKDISDFETFIAAVLKLV